MEDFPVAARLKNVINTLGLSDSQFADRCSISRPTLSLLLSGKNKKISDIMLTQIHEAFPEISILWLLFGEGDMFKNENSDTPNQNLPDENQSFKENDQIEKEDLNLVNVKQLETIIQDVVNKSFMSSQNDIEKIILKISQRENLKKANKITVYYDDSTFETFVPEKR